LGPTFENQAQLLKEKRVQTDVLPCLRRALIMTLSTQPLASLTTSYGYFL
jgi:hypothetical protein